CFVVFFFYFYYDIVVNCFMFFCLSWCFYFFFFQAEDGIRDRNVTGVQTWLFRSTAIRSLALQGCNTFDRQQGLGFGFAMIPFLEYLYQDNDEELSEALLRQTALFNITPQMVNFVLGITMAMEEEGANNPDFDKSSINAMKTALMGPLSGLGDAIFWGSLRTIAIGVGIAFSAGGSILGPLSFFLIYNIPAFFVRYYGMILGYEKG